VRQYALERLREGGEEAQWRGRHLAHFVAVTEEAEPQLTGADQRTWLERLEAEHDNLRSALAWSSTAGGDAARGLCFRQLDVAHFDALIWLTPGTSVIVRQASAVRGVTV
jgi:predicted ATPase